ncbi:unnamed protein product [Tilletia laevis]|uniref:Elongator complex protein 4 n=1 Tax=Tilletia laevis TaxID=157183 RepID=A0A9N8MCH4_9BASI|nr:unnamed protein product [Tilletia laevis]
MSSFKRRTGASASASAAVSASTPSSSSAAAILPVGVRRSATSSLPQALLTTGIPALDDLVAGRGIPSGTSLLLIPEDYTQPLTTARAAAAPLQPWALVPAEPYTDLVLAYGLAQGIAHQHTNLIIGEQPQHFAHSLMARIGDLPPPVSSPSPVNTQASAKHDVDQLKIAFRYANMPILNSPHPDQDDSSSASSSSNSAVPAAKEFPSTFDLSRRISPHILEQAERDGHLHCIDVSSLAPAESSGSMFDQVWDALQQIVGKLKLEAEETPDAPPPVLRIHIRALGSPAWHPSTSHSHPVDLARFLLRIKTLLRSLSVPPVPGMSQHPSSGRTIPAIATLTLSPHALTSSSSSSESGTVDVAHRLSSIADTALALSSFDARPSLRHLLIPPTTSSSSSSARKSAHGYTGAIRVLRSAAGIGGAANEIVRASVLRGMSASSSAPSSSSSSSATGGASSEGGGGGGAGAGENDLAFRVGRKKLTLELLQVDDVGLARKEEQEQEQQNGGHAGGGGGAGDVLKMMDELRVKEEELRLRAVGGRTGPTSTSQQQQQTSPRQVPSSSPSPTARMSPSPTSPTSKAALGSGPHPTGGAMNKLGMGLGGGGLASLRAKGLAARAAATATASASVSSTGPTPGPSAKEAGARARAPVVVELEGAGVEEGGRAAAAGAGGAGTGIGSTARRKPVFEKRADQLEF